MPSIFKKRHGNTTEFAILVAIWLAALASCHSGEDLADDGDWPENVETPTPPPEPSFSNDELKRASVACIEGGFDAVEPGERVTSYHACTEIQHTAGGPLLIKRLSEEADSVARGHLVEALGKLGTPEARSLLDELYQETEPPLEPWFAGALYRLGVDDARSWLVELARNDDIDISLKAALALADISDPGDLPAQEALNRLYQRQDELRDVDIEAPYLVLIEMARLGNELALQQLYSWLEEDHEYRQVVVAEGLARIGDESGKGLLRAVLDDEGSEYRVRAAAALIEIGDYSGHEVLSGALAHRLVGRRRRAARALGTMALRDSIRPLIALRDGDADRTVRINACVAIMLIVGLEPRELVRVTTEWAKGALASADPAMRDAGARLIGDLPREEAIELLSTAATDAQSTVREQAARSAARLKGSREAATIMAAALEKEGDPQVQLAQITALARIAMPEARDALQKVASDSDRVGIMATGALIAVGDPAAAEALDRAYRNPQPVLRLAVMESAILAENPVVVPTLTRGVRDRIFAVRFVAAEGLALYRAARDLAVKVLREGLGKEVGIVARARTALLRLGVTIAGVPPVADMLSSNDVVTRRAAIPIIAAMEWKQASPLIRRALLDTDHEVRSDAVDIIEVFTEQNKEGVRRLYKSVVSEDGAVDDASRYKARVRLAGLLPRAREGSETAALAPGQPGEPDIRPVEEALQAVEAARATFQAAKKELDDLVAETRNDIARRATSEETLDRTRENQARVKQAHQRMSAAQRELARRVEGVEQAAEPLPRSLPAVQNALTAARSHQEEAAADVTAVKAGVSDLQKRVDRWIAAETAQVKLYCQTAETAIPAGRLSEARQSLRAAERLAKGQPCVLYWRGKLHDEVATRARTDRKRRQNLQWAMTSYEKFIAVGDGYRIELATERIGEIKEELGR